MAEDEPKNSNEKIEPSNGTPFAPLGICARCHRPLTRPSTAGGCLPCLIDFVGLDEPPAAPGSGEVRRYSHFEIALEADGSLAELGHGAMGTTYRAVDTVLHSPVALKVIGRNVADSPAVRSRFLREARTAARLRHPNVASVFHYGEQEGECFYVMELVEGETLEARVRRDGPLPVPTVLEIGVQVTRALEAAEAQHLVHRDIKPGNLMWVSRSRTDKLGGAPLIKVIDFGLAKALTGETDATGETDTRHGFSGTPAYASPEQFARAEDRPIDTRSDLYSLGVTLWHLLCGRTPFRGGTLEEIHRQQTRQPLPVDQLIARRVPAPVVALLRSMLAVSPAARPQSTRELLDALNRCRQQLLRGPLARHARFAVALGAVAATVLGGVLWREHTRPVPERSIAVLPFENLSPDPADAFYTSGIHDEVAADLAHLPELTVISTDSTIKYPAGGPRDEAAIGRELGVTHLLVGSCRREGQQMHIELKLVDLRNPSRLWTKSYDRQLTDVFAVQGEIARAVVDQFQVALSPFQRAIINRPPTRDPAAYELYLRAIRAPEILPDETAVRKDAERQITLLDQAVARDPDFLLALCALVVEHDYAWSHSTGATPEELLVNHRTLADEALRKAQSLQPDAGEVHLAAARHLLRIDDKSGQALVEANLARKALPNNARAECIVGDIDADHGRWDEAVHAYEHAVTLDPRSSYTRWQLALLYEVLRRYEDFDRSMALLLPIAPTDEQAEMRMERARGSAESSGDLQPMQTVLAGISDAEDSDGSTRVSWGVILSLLAHDPDGIDRRVAAQHEDAFWIEGVPFPKPWYQAWAARMRGDEAGAKAAFGAAHTAMVKFVAERPRNPVRLILLAMTDAGLGNKDAAVAEARRACELMPYATEALSAPTMHCALAAVYGMTGQSDLAFQTLDEGVQHPAGEWLLYLPSYGDFVLDPIWDPLRSDPRFAALLKRLAPESPR